jgi:hypothetical protein
MRASPACLLLPGRAGSAVAEGYDFFLSRDIGAFCTTGSTLTEARQEYGP